MKTREKTDKRIWSTRAEQAFVRKHEDNQKFREGYVKGFKLRSEWGRIDREQLRVWLEERWGVKL